MKEIRRCANCKKYMMTIEQLDKRDNNAERLKYCMDCLNERMNRTSTIEEFEAESAARHPTVRDIERQNEEDN